MSPTSPGQSLTKAVYRDPAFVAAYVEIQGKHPKMFAEIDRFAQTLPGKRVIDIGCGPGHDSYHFAQLGFTVTGIDYSPEMIASARTLIPSAHPPRFEVMDILELSQHFAPDSFDGAWACASLIHIPESDIPQVLRSINSLVVNHGKVYIGLKQGPQGTTLVSETKYGLPTEREFILWDENNFYQLAHENGLITDFIEKVTSGTTGNTQTTWLNFYFSVHK